MPAEPGVLWCREFSEEEGIWRRGDPSIEFEEKAWGDPKKRTLHEMAVSLCIAVQQGRHKEVWEPPRSGFTLEVPGAPTTPSRRRCECAP